MNDDPATSQVQILDGSSKLNTVLVNQELRPDDLTAAGSSWEELKGPYDVVGDQLVVLLTDEANQYVIADAVRIERLGP